MYSLYIWMSKRTASLFVLYPLYKRIHIDRYELSLGELVNQRNQASLRLAHCRLTSQMQSFLGTKKVGPLESSEGGLVPLYPVGLTQRLDVNIDRYLFSTCWEHSGSNVRTTGYQNPRAWIAHKCSKESLGSLALPKPLRTRPRVLAVLPNTSSTEQSFCESNSYKRGVENTYMVIGWISSLRGRPY